MSISVIDTIVSADQVEDAMIDTLQTWFLTYLREIEWQRDLTLGLPTPRSYTHTDEFTDLPDEMLPRVLIVSPGMAAIPWAEGDGTVHATWAISVSIIVSSTSRQEVNRNCKIYAAAARTLLLQQKDLGGIADYTDLVSERYIDGDSDQMRSLGVASLDFTVSVPCVGVRTSGPTEPVPPDPDTIPGSNWPIAETADVDVRIVEVDGGGEWPTSTDS